MKHKTLRFGKGFRVALELRKLQAAEMVLAPGDSEGGPDNRHRGADQWLFVVAGTGWLLVRVWRITCFPTQCPTGKAWVKSCWGCR